MSSAPRSPRCFPKLPEDTTVSVTFLCNLHPGAPRFCRERAGKTMLRSSSAGPHAVRPFARESRKIA